MGGNRHRGPDRRRLSAPAHQPDVTYAIFLAEPVADLEPAPQVDLGTELLLRDAAWHPVTCGNPLGPLQHEYRGYLEPLIQRLLRSSHGT